MDTLSKLAVSFKEGEAPVTPPAELLDVDDVVEDIVTEEDPTALFRLLIISTILLLLFMTLSGHVIEKCKVSF